MRPRRHHRRGAGSCLCGQDRTVTLYSPRPAVEQFFKRNPLTLGNKLAERITVDAKSWDQLSTVAIHLLGWSLHPIILSEMLTRSTFMRFDLDSDSYKETEVYVALRRLQSEIRLMNDALARDPLVLMFKHSRTQRSGHVGDAIRIETMPLATLLYVLDRWVNILELSRSIIRHLDGRPFSMPSLRSDSPVQGMQQEIDAERPTQDEISSYIAVT